MPRKVESAESINIDTLLRANASFNPKNFSLKEREIVPETGKKKIVVPAGFTATILTACAPTPSAPVIIETPTQQVETSQVEKLISPQNQFWQEFENINPNSPWALSQEKVLVNQNGEIVYAITPIINEKNNQNTSLSLVTINKNGSPELRLAAEFVTTLPSNPNETTLDQFKSQDVFGLYFLPENNLIKLKNGEQLILVSYLNFSDIFYGFVLKNGIRYEDFAQMIANAKTQEELIRIFSENITHQLTRDPNTGELKVTKYVINNQQQILGIKAILTPTTPATSISTPTETPTPIPQIEVNGINIPDPHITNPELFDLTKKDSPIPQFVNALNNAGIEITPEQVLQGLTYQAIEVPKRDPQTGEVIKDETGNEVRETVVFGVYNLPPEVFPPEYQELAGEYPILMWQKEKGWFILTARELAGIKRVNIGNLESHYDRVAKNPDLTRKFFNTFNTWLITWYQKWDLVEPKQKEYNYSALDKYLTLANKNNIRPLGGPLVYFYEYPKWLTNSSLSKDKIEEALKSHVFETVLRYKDMINFWIVVNEYHNTPAEPDFLNNILSQNYVEIAFKEARRANPNAILIYNDNTIESQKGRWFNQTYNLVRKLKDQGIIDGVGMQMHLNQPNWTGVPTNEELREAIAKFRELGLEVYITEMDIVEKGTRPNLNQARDYYNVIITYLNSTKGQKMQLISFFGFTDAHSWYDEVLHNPDANPLLFDDLGKPKLSYYAFIKALFEYSIRD